MGWPRSAAVMCTKFWLARLAVESSMRENARNDSASVESACSSKSATNRSVSVSPCSSAMKRRKSSSDMLFRSRASPSSGASSADSSGWVWSSDDRRADERRIHECVGSRADDLGARGRPSGTGAPSTSLANCVARESGTGLGGGSPSWDDSSAGAPPSTWLANCARICGCKQTSWLSSNRTPRILSPAPPSGSSDNACSSVPCCVRSAVLAAARTCTSAVSSSRPSLAKSAALKTRRAQSASPLGSHGHGGHLSSSSRPSCHFLSFDAPPKTMSRRHALPWASRYAMRSTWRDRARCLPASRENPGLVLPPSPELLETVSADTEVVLSLSDVERPSSLASTLALSEDSLPCEVALPAHAPAAAREAATAGGTLGPKHEGRADCEACEASRHVSLELCLSVAPVSLAALAPVRHAASLAPRRSLVNDCETDAAPRIWCETGATRLIWSRPT
mmetsp:Transcript_79776/g.193174  ORF Transcript_79776/g.193174 Transcript_79776/m.193174 type:complete len:451 (-) Transcript_79776:350-1702(-)